MQFTNIGSIDSYVGERLLTTEHHFALQGKVKRLVSSSKNIPPNQKWSTRGTLKNILLYPDFSTLRRKITHEIQVNIAASRNSVAEIEFFDSWVSVAEPGQSEKIQVVENSLLTGIYCIKAATNSGYMSEFVDPKVTSNQANNTFKTKPFSFRHNRLIVLRNSKDIDVSPNLSGTPRILLGFCAAIRE